MESAWSTAEAATSKIDMMKRPLPTPNGDSKKVEVNGTSKRVDPSFVSSRQTIEGERQTTIPLKRQDLLRWYGWGYVDSEVTVDKTTGEIHCTSDRYPGVNGTYIPQEVREWVRSQIDIDLYETSEKLITAKKMPKSFPEPFMNEDFVKSVISNNIIHSVDGEDRYIRGHGHGIDEILVLRESKLFDRIPDIVLWPGCHDDVVKVVELATKHNVVIIPYGGGTNVSRALACNPEEHRMIVSLDTSQMNRVLWVDKANLVACCESGIIGQDLGRELEKHGLTTGHEPDSYEFSSLGGWVATRASGMKKNLYGNIEDLVVHVRFVTPGGVLEKQNQAPRVSCGPDFNHIVLGSEGTLGVITDVVIKVRPIPECQEFGSFVFPNFQCGVDFMREVARKRCQPASLRLMDNDQFKLGQIFKENHGPMGHIMDIIKMLYVTKYKGIDLDQMCVAIAVFEGDTDDVQTQKNKIAKISQKFDGFSAGARNGERGYLMTFTISYIRDVIFAHNVYSESMETSAPWDRVVSLYRNVKQVVAKECRDRGIQYFQCNCRVTQVYDSGACLYFYFAFNAKGVANSLHVFDEIEAMARDEILACGGSISHHHGVGKIRQKWFQQEVSPVGVALCKAVKRQLDPNNIFACGNLWMTTKSSL